MAKRNSGGLRYVGQGAYIMGVPARDLTAEEAERHADAIRVVETAGQVLYMPAESLARSEAPQMSAKEE